MVLLLKKRGLLYLLGILLISFSVSPICVTLMTKFLSVNFSELFFIPGLYFVIASDKAIRHELKYNLKNKSFIRLFITLLVFFAIGLITGNNIANVYGDFRTISVFIFFSVLTIKSTINQEKFKSFIIYVFITLSLLDFIFLLLRKSFFSLDLERFIVMAVCPFVVSIFFLNKNKFIYSLFFLSILIYESVVSTMRINYILIIFYVIYMIFVFASSFSNRKISLIKIFVFSLVVLFMALKLTPIIKNYFESNGSRYVHTIMRTTETVNNFEEGEAIRLNTTLIFLKEPFDLIIPQGLGWRNHIKRIQLLFRQQYGILSTMDSNVFYCIYHFGLFIGFFIVILFFRLFFRLILKANKRTSKLGISYYLMLSGVILSMFLLKSWIFVYLNFGFIYSLLIILIRYPDKELLKKIG